ncbi:MAG TPA: XRE family transcriptional regulator [Pseudonocardiaceae bacterium]|jgi:Zn-dependent peptidase ImmA (M78 family)/transcriptional regulator with XRE-family HTH domain|nr:XRE family transcriptional regulator [Pseudonocardiaceae bacterium]
MDTAASWLEIGERIAEARRAADMSQGELATRIGLDRTAMVRIEAGERRVSALELARLGEELGVPMAHFVSRPPAPLASQRRGLDETTDSASRSHYRLDVLLETHARNAQWLVEQGFLVPPAPSVDVPRSTTGVDVGEVTKLARNAREAMGAPSGPLGALASVVEEFGLYVTVADEDAEGASLLLEGFGVAIISGRSEPGRRRWTAAHELGHHLLHDAYNSDVGVAAGRDGREQLVDRFAGEFLLPDNDLLSTWRRMSGADQSPRDVLLGLATDYRLSWSAVVARARQAALVNVADARRLRANTPVRGDFLAIRGSEPSPDLTIGETGAQWRRAVLSAWHQGAITGARTVELLYGAVTVDDLPARNIADCLP